MDETIRHHNPNPLINANPLSKLFFWWLNDLFKSGYKRNLEVEDMFNVMPEDTSKLLGNKLQREWEKELLKTESGGKPSLLKAMIRSHGKKFMLLGLIAFFEEAVKVVQPVLLGVLIRYFVPDSTVSRTEAYVFASGISLCAISLAISHHPYFFGVAHIGMQIRVACCSLLYRKALKLSNKALGQTTTGQIVNLMSNDVNRFDQAVLFIHFLWIGPVQALVVLYLLWRQLGPATLSGFAVLVLLMPLQTWMGKLFSRFRRKTAVHTDERIKFMNEIISGMRVIKMYCWEKPFGQLIEKVRRKEIEKIRSANVARSLILAPFFVSSKLIIFLMFLTVILTKNSLLAEQVFVAMALLTPVRLVMNLFVPFAIQLSSETKVTISRLEEMDKIRSANIARAMLLTPYIVSLKLILLLMFVTVVLTGKPLVAEHVFVAIAFLTPIRGVMNLFVPLAIQGSSEALVTIHRLEITSQSQHEDIKKDPRPVTMPTLISWLSLTLACMFCIAFYLVPTLISWLSLTLACMFCIAFYLGVSLRPDMLFSSMALMQVLTFTMLGYINLMIQMVGEFYTSAQRLQVLCYQDMSISLLDGST